jgi:hypothetical protein
LPAEVETMIERSRDSSRDLLEELEDGWATPHAPGVAPPAKIAATMESDAGETEEDLELLAGGNEADLAKLDEGWLDDLFPGEDEDDADEDEEPEPELPDERLDPEAYALAKQAREERSARRKDRKKAKAEAKRARQKARLAAVRQKKKSKKARPAGRRDEPAPKKGAAPSSGAVRVERPAGDATRASGPLPRAPERGAPARPARSTMASVKLLAIVLATLLALAAAIAAIAK